MRRVVVTGLGLVTPCGNDLASAWDAVVHGRSGIDTIKAWDPSGIATHIAGEVRGLDPQVYGVTAKEIRRMDPFQVFALAASHQALAHAGFAAGADGVARLPDALADDAACVMGVGLCGISTIAEGHHLLVTKGPRRGASPFHILQILSNLVPGYMSMKHNLKGPNLVTASACASATNAIGEGFEMVASGRVQVAVCGGTEATVELMPMASFCAMRAMSTRNDAPQAASRPFDRERDGFVMGEGAGVLVLEPLEAARERGANILAEVVGYGSSADANHPTQVAPEGEGAQRAMRSALKRARLDATQLDYINAHGTSTEVNDSNETLAIKKVFGDHARKLWVSSTKSMTGHLIGAAGAVEAIFSIMTCLKGVVPPTINLDNPDPVCDLDYVPHTAREKRIDYALSNSFGFGGANASLVFRRFAD